MVVVRYVVVGLMLACSIASAETVSERLEGVTHWKGRITFKDNWSMKVEEKKDRCLIGEQCEQTVVSKKEDLNKAVIIATDKPDDTKATVTVKTHLSTKTTRRYIEQCPGPPGGSMLDSKPGPKKGGAIAEYGAVDTVGTATAEAEVSIEVVSDTDYLVKFTVPQVQIDSVYTTTGTAAGGCSPRKAANEPQSRTKMATLAYHVEYKAKLPTPMPKQLSQLVLAGKGSQANWEFTWNLRPVVKTGLTADAGPRRTVAWGQSVELDGSRSKPKGRITYRWKATSAECATEGELSMMKEVKGEKVKFQPLCSMTMELIVSDGKDEATATVDVEVTRRTGPDWTTTVPKTKLDWSFAPDEKADPKWAKPTKRDGTDDVTPADLKWGENVCIHEDDHKTTKFGVTHPHPTDIAGIEARGTAQWKGGGLELATVNDNGPFHGWSYVKRTSIVIERAAIFNQAARPNAPAPDPNEKRNIRAANAQPWTDLSGTKTTVYDAWKAALELHEGEGHPKRPATGHTKRIRDAVKRPELDPRRRVEPLAAPDVMRLWSKADEQLLDVNKALVEISVEVDEDPLTDDKLIFRGPFHYWVPSKKAWQPVTREDM